MIAQREYDAHIGPSIERFLSARGVPFRIIEDGGDARADDQKDGDAASESEAVALGDGTSAVLCWGMVNCTHMDWEGHFPQNRSGTAFARLDFVHAGKDCGRVVVVARYWTPACMLMPEFRGWWIGLWEPFTYPRSPAHPRAVALAETLGIRSEDGITAGSAEAERCVIAMADFNAAARS